MTPRLRVRASAVRQRAIAGAAHSSTVTPMSTHMNMPAMIVNRDGTRRWLKNGSFLSTHHGRGFKLPSWNTKNVTIPAGVAVLGASALTVAENVTACPDTDGLAEVSSVVTVLASLTIWERTLEVLELKLPSPLV